MWNCHYHPGNQLTNFCVNKYCSLPLCPKCINCHIHDGTQNHDILPLGDVIAMIKQQVFTSIQGFVKQRQSIGVEYHPQNILKNYDIVIQKHKAQTHAQIQRYYQSLRQQMHLNLNNLYNQTLAQLNYPIQQKINLLQRNLRNLQNNTTILETIINFNSQSQI